MTDMMRWRYGETHPVVLPVLAATVIEIGDLLFMDGTDVKPAAVMADQGTLADNQVEFHATFAGVAMQRSRADDEQSIRVATRGVFEFACASGTHEVGAWIGAVESAGGIALENQVVAGVATAASAIGRCARRVNPAATRVLVDLVSTLVHGGPQPAV